MLKMFDLVSQKLLKTGEMLKMLKMLKVFWGNLRLQTLTSEVFPKNFNIFNIFNISPVLSIYSKTTFNIFNISPVLSTFWSKSA